MASFTKYYANLFATFGYPLTERLGLAAEEIAAAERRLLVRVPAALRDYYRIAGRERRFGRSCHQLLPIYEWSVDRKSKRLIFMSENQGVCCWGVSVRNPDSANPPVSQGTDDGDGDGESIAWRLEHRKCTVFLAVMLHIQAVSGGYRFCGQADAAENTKYPFEKQGWTYFGQLKGTRAYSRPNRVVCLDPPGLPFLPHGQVLAGGKTRRDLQAIGEELGVSFA